MKMTGQAVQGDYAESACYVLLINRDFTVFYTNYYDITGVVKPAETRRWEIFCAVTMPCRQQEVAALTICVSTAPCGMP